MARKSKVRLNGFMILRLIGIILFIVILFRVDLSKVWIQIQSVGILYLILAIIFQIILLYLKALRWHLLNDATSSKKRILQSFGEFFESYAIGVVTPGRLGELIKAGHSVGRDNKINAGLRVVAERGIDIGFFLFIAGLAAFLTDLLNMGKVWGLGITGSGILAMLVSSLLLFSDRAVAIINKIISLFIRNKNSAFFARKSRSLSANTWIFLLSILSNISYFISCFYLAKGIGLSLNFLESSIGVAFAGLLNMLPVTVMGLGTRELTFLFVFQELNPDKVLAFSGLVFLVAQIGGGLLSLIMGQVFLFRVKKLKLRAGL